MATTGDLRTEAEVTAIVDEILGFRIVEDCGPVNAAPLPVLVQTETKQVPFVYPETVQAAPPTKTTSPGKANTGWQDSLPLAPFGEEFLTKKQMARVLGVSPRTVERLVALKAIPHVRMKTLTGKGQRIFFVVKEMKAWLEKRISHKM